MDPLPLNPIQYTNLCILSKVMDWAMFHSGLLHTEQAVNFGSKETLFGRSGDSARTVHFYSNTFNVSDSVSKPDSYHGNCQMFQQLTGNDVDQVLHFGRGGHDVESGL